MNNKYNYELLAALMDLKKTKNLTGEKITEIYESEEGIKVTYETLRKNYKKAKKVNQDKVKSLKRHIEKIYFNGKEELKKDNKELLFFLLTKQQEKVLTWRQASQIYFDETGIDLPPSTLADRTRRIVASEINTSRFLSYYSKYDKYYFDKLGSSNEKVVETDKGFKVVYSDTKGFLMENFSIPPEDLEPIFGIDLKKDDDTTQALKIRRKLANPLFLLEYLGFDPCYFELSKFEFGGWNVAVKTQEADQTDSLKQVINLKCSVIIKPRKQPIPFITPERFFETFKKFLVENKKELYKLFNFLDVKPEYESHGLNDDKILVMPAIELHLGKLASLVDIEDYSTTMALWRHREIVRQVIARQQKEKAAKLIIGIGNDYFNADTVDDTTTAGTPQNNDTRWQETYVWAKIAQIATIEVFKKYFNEVIVQYVPGNHDEKTSYSLFVNIHDFYHLTNDPKVKVQLTYKDARKWAGYMHGENLIVQVHGKAPNGRALNDKKLRETVYRFFPEESRKAKHIYIFAGHLHNDSVTKENNVTVIRTASPTGIDAWHADNGYVNARQGHAVYVIDKEADGLEVTNYITIKNKDKKKKISGPSRDENLSMPAGMEKALGLTQEKLESELTQEETKQLQANLSNYERTAQEECKNHLKNMGINPDKMTEEQFDYAMNILGYKPRIEKSKEYIQEKAHELTLTK
ncbi:MAG TPA: hypothetical protein GX690_01940 [Tenericutes bacterium]|nr:hypothetical protein [Mycoplasmatota bacterium]